jgi:hypothetical protein
MQWLQLTGQRVGDAVSASGAADGDAAALAPSGGD